MKKFLFLIIMTTILITLSGCGKKTVTCEGNIIESDVASTVKVVGNFDNDKLKSQTIERLFDMTNYLQYADITTYYSSFQEEYEKFNEYEGITASVSKENDTTLKVVINIDLEKVDDETYQSLNIGNGSIEVSSVAFIEEFENNNLTCNEE